MRSPRMRGAAGVAQDLRGAHHVRRSSGTARPGPGTRRRSRAAPATRGARSAPARRSPTAQVARRSPAGPSRRTRSPARSRPGRRRTRSSAAARAGCARPRRRGRPPRGRGTSRSGSTALRRRSTTCRRSSRPPRAAPAAGLARQPAHAVELVAVLADEPAHHASRHAGVQPEVGPERRQRLPASGSRRCGLMGG